jgi:hypothetical protein
LFRYVILFPEFVPTLTVPADTCRSAPPLAPFIVQENAPALMVPPLFQKPAPPVKEVEEVKGVMVDALDNLNVPEVITSGLDAAFSVISDVASRIFPNAPLFT